MGTCIGVGRPWPGRNTEFTDTCEHKWNPLVPFHMSVRSGSSSLCFPDGAIGKCYGLPEDVLRQVLKSSGLCSQGGLRDPGS